MPTTARHDADSGAAPDTHAATTGRHAADEHGQRGERGQVRAFRLPPRQPVRLPGTRCELWFDGEQEHTVYQRDGFWDLSPLTKPGRVVVWQRLASRPHLGWWPIAPLTTRATYRGGGAEPRHAAVRQAAA